VDLAQARSPRSGERSPLAQAASPRLGEILTEALGGFSNTRLGEPSLAWASPLLAWAATTATHLELPNVLA